MNDAKIPEIIQREAVENPTPAEGKKLVATIQQVNSEGTPDSSKTEEIYLYADHVAYEKTKKYTGVSSLGQLVLEAVEGTAASVGDPNASNYVGKEVVAEKKSAKDKAILASAVDDNDPSVILVKTKAVFKTLSTLDYRTKKVVILADIDMTGENWTPLGDSDDISIVIEGNNHTIKGLNKALINQTGNVSISDLTIEMAAQDANIPTYNAAFVAYASHQTATDSRTITLTNCHARGTIKATNTAGGLLGWISARGQDAPTTINVNNCTVDATINSNYRAGGVLGHCSYISEQSMINNVVVSGSISSTGTDSSAGGNKAVGGLIGFAAGGTKLQVRNCKVNTTAHAEFAAQYGEFTAVSNGNTIVGICNPAFNDANTNNMNKLNEDLTYTNSHAKFGHLIKASIMNHAYTVNVDTNVFNIDTNERLTDINLNMTEGVDLGNNYEFNNYFKNNTEQLNSIKEHYNSNTLDEIVLYCPFTDISGNRLTKSRK